MELWSWVLTAVGMTGIYLTTQKKIIGFAIGLSAQFLWITYALVSNQYGFIVSAFGYGFINMLGLIRWSRKDEEAQTDESD